MALEEVSQRELAERVEVAPSTLSEWLSGKTSPSTTKLLKLAEVLDTDVEDISLSLPAVSIGSNSIVYVYNVYNVATGASVTTHIHNSTPHGSPTQDAGNSDDSDDPGS
jgi:transcriptional regulator with XRE-family HTH domain